MTVTFDRETREIVRRVARQEDRSESAQVRHWLKKAIAAEQGAVAA
jgi:hypothetical protein